MFLYLEMELAFGIRHKERKNTEHFELTCWAFLKGMKVQLLSCLKMLGTSYTVMCCHIPETQRPQIHCCKNRKTCKIKQI
jgi:hypothetical protein